MDRIRQVYASLSKQEQKYLRSYLAAFHSRGANKSLELIELVEEKPEVSNQEAAEKLYGDPGSKAFIMLKSRLLEKMLEVMALSVNYYNNPSYKEDSLLFDRIILYRDLMHALLVSARGMTGLAYELLSDVAQRAERFFMSNIRLMALTNMQLLSRDSQEVLVSLPPKIDEALQTYITEIEIARVNDRVRAISDGRLVNAEEAIEYLETSFPRIEERLQKHYSPLGEYLHLQLLSYFYTYHHNIESHKQILSRFQALFEKYPNVANRTRRGAPYYQATNIAIKERRYDDACQLALTAMKIFSPRRVNYVLAGILGVCASLLTQRFDEAEDILKKISWYENGREEDSRIGHIRYFRSALLFFQRKYREALHTLHQIDSLQRDREGWNGSLRVFEIILLIELGDMDVAAARIESMRKHISRYKVEKRIDLIQKVLHQLDRNSFHFAQPSPDLLAALDTLAAEAPWRPDDFEVVHFDAWMKARMTGSDFIALMREMV